MISIFLPITALCWREIIRFFRQKNRVIGAVLPPLLFWFLIGSGMGGSFRHLPHHFSSNAQEGLNYLQYFFPGTIVMIVLFTAIFSTISIIEDRREGFLQSMLVSPVPRWKIALGKMLGGTLLAFSQGLIFLLFIPALAISFRLGPFLFTFLALFLISFGLTGLGFAFAWKMDSTQGFHAVMNLFLMPMWFLSGALFPLESAPHWLRWLMVMDPLTYGVSALRYGLYSQNLSGLTHFPTPFFCLFAISLFCLVTFSLSVWSCSSRE